LRILHVFDRYLSGGFERHFDLVTAELSHLGVEQYVYGGEGADSLRRRSEFAEVVRGNFSELSPQDVLQQVRGIESVVRRRGIDVVHVHPWLGLIAAPLAAGLAGVPHIVTAHAPPRPADMAAEFGALYFETVSQLTLPHAAAITAVSEEACEGVRTAFGLDRGDTRLTVVRNPVPSADDSSGPSDAPPQALFVSRLDADKEASSREAIELFASIERRMPGWRFVVCGDGDRRRELQRHAENIGLRAVSWLGWRDDACCLMRQSSLVVGMGRVAAEAIAQGRTTLLAGYGGLADFVTPGNIRQLQAGNYGARGWPRRSPEVLTERLPAVLADEESRRELRAIALSDHGSDVVARRYREIYCGARGALPEAFAREVVRVLEATRVETIRDCAWLEELGPQGFSFWPPARRALLFEVGRQYGLGLRQAEHARRMQGLTIDKLGTQLAKLERERQPEPDSNAATSVRLAEERVGKLERILADTRRAAIARDEALEKTTTELAAAVGRAGELAVQLERAQAELRKMAEAPLLERLKRRGLRTSEAQTGAAFDTPLASLSIDVPPIPGSAPARRVAEARFDIVVLPIFDWEFRHQRPQQLAEHLARAGHRVYWISPTRMLAGGGALFGTAPLLPNLYEVSLQGDAVDLYRSELAAGNLEALAAGLRELYRDQAIAESAVLIQFPFWRRLGLALRREHGARLVYDCMDDWQNWPAEPRISDFALNEERALVVECDVLSVSSRGLVDRYAANRPAPVLVRNAADYAFFRRGGRPAEALDLRGPVVGYYGAIAQWFDVEMVLAAATARPGYTFVLIGAVHDVDVSALAALPNVRLPGEKKYSELPGWLERFDAAIIPFRITALTRAVDPVKFYEYLSIGTPVVATPMPELLEHRALIRIAESCEQFTAALDEAVREPKDAPVRIERTAFAASNTWGVRAAAVETEIERAFPLVSVIVLTHNSAAFMDVFWDSFRRNTSWPAWELLIADNASMDDTVRIAERFAREDQRVRVLAFEDNAGFAAGNNRAAREARGEYLLFVNPDVIVTSGWMWRLALAAMRGPKAGIVTCVTNFAGNETRINVGYRDLAGLERFAERLAIAQRGVTAEVGVAAFFCAMVPRRVWDEVGELDERFGAGMFEDDDFSTRVRQAGYRVFSAEDCFVHHFGNGSFSQLPLGESDRLFERNRRLYEEKWKRAWQPHRSRPGVLPLDKTRLFKVESFRSSRVEAPPQIRFLHPSAIRLGETLNPQAAESSLLVIECMNATPDTEIEFGGRLLRTNYGGPNWVSAPIPEELLRVVGKVPVRLVRAHDASEPAQFQVLDEAAITTA
jgi:GT2 family glycosyltransferase/glycosyltransferase involved in cell wall biosynthesis